MGDAAEIFEIFYSQWNYQKVNISRILKFLTWHGFDEFGWNDPIDTFIQQGFTHTSIILHLKKQWDPKNANKTKETDFLMRR